MVRISSNGASAPQTATNDPGVVPASKFTTQKRRFGAYFPRVFACVYSLTGDDEAAKAIVSDAFGRAFEHSTELSEEEFIVELFTMARDLSRSYCADRGKSGTLTGREQEVLAFVFDARLSREDIRRLMGTTEQGLSATLLRSLRKLKTGIRPAAAVTA